MIWPSAFDRFARKRKGHAFNELSRSRQGNAVLERRVSQEAQRGSAEGVGAAFEDLLPLQVDVENGRVALLR